MPALPIRDVCKETMLDVIVTDDSCHFERFADLISAEALLEEVG